jgi:hypothetical protein
MKDIHPSDEARRDERKEKESEGRVKSRKQKGNNNNNRPKSKVPPTTSDGCRAISEWFVS